MPNLTGPQYDINELAAMHDVSPSVIRKYEAIGLFNKSIARAKQNRRVFTSEDSDRLGIILGLRNVAEPEVVKIILDRLDGIKTRIKARGKGDRWPSKDLTPEEATVDNWASEVEAGDRTPTKGDELLKHEAEMLAATLKQLLEKAERRHEAHRKFISDFLKPICHQVKNIAERAPTIQQIRKGRKE